VASAAYSYESATGAWATKYQDDASSSAEKLMLVRTRPGLPRALPEKQPASELVDGIVGSSDALRLVLEQAKTVAGTDASVLITGETGTGKELIARAIHGLSLRRNCSFVTFNCAAIPSGLLESELFGHERGAFTGAIARKLGRFELADKGTLFLDEAGEIPIESQPKLLRALQEREIERLGGMHSKRIDVRLVAASNRDLAKMVANKEFRSDLYFRLNVFPIFVPPLRDRREDIPQLASAFVKMYAARMNKSIETIPSATMKALQQYHWPGNIRELQNFIERAVILSPGTVLLAPVSDLQSANGAMEHSEPVTLSEAETEHILKILRETNWVVGGPRGAAARLGLKRTTLVSKMQRLGLARPQAREAI
jgi:formate hydrogenlyase transcriptional activator